MRKFKLLIDIPFLKKGDFFWILNGNGLVYYLDDGEIAKYPLRSSLAGYLNLLCTNPKYMEFIEKNYDY